MAMLGCTLFLTIATTLSNGEHLEATTVRYGKYSTGLCIAKIHHTKNLDYFFAVYEGKPFLGSIIGYDSKSNLEMFSIPFFKYAGRVRVEGFLWFTVQSVNPTNGVNKIGKIVYEQTKKYKLWKMVGAGR
jgi:hypothetical protein